MSFDVNQLKHFPNEPGVYLMKDSKGTVLYVGKAKELRKRLKNYFSPGQDGRAMVPFLTAKVDTIDTIVVRTEKEALLLENTLIKRHQPQYNAVLKDDKTFVSLMINDKHQWPQVRLVRYKGKPSEKGQYFGPYTSAHAARQTYDLITRLFPLRQCSDEELKRRKRPCLLYGMKRCIAPCVNKCTQKEYDAYVEGATKFLNGEDKQILKNLYEEMEAASEALQFEKAAALLKTIRQIEHVTETEQIVDKAGGANCDAWGLYRLGNEVIIVVLLVREGKLVGSEQDRFKEVAADDEEILESYLIQHYKKHPAPKELLLPFSLSSALEDILETKCTVPKMGEKKSLVKLAGHNAKTLFEQQDPETLAEKTLLELQETLKLSRYPKRIECFDTSNISGSDLVACMVAFTEGMRESKRQRYYHIRGITKGDDYASLHQVLSRRLMRAKEENDLPDLIIVDGGKGQLNIALDVFKELDIATVDLISLAKEEARHDKGMTQEKVFLPHHSEPILLPLRSPLLLLLQKIRDEAHRVAIGFHRKQRSKRTLTSALDNLPGIGPTKRGALLRKFGSVKRILDATPEELSEIQGITKKDIETIKKLKSK